MNTYTVVLLYPMWAQKDLEGSPSVFVCYCDTERWTYAVAGARRAAARQVPGMEDADFILVAVFDGACDLLTHAEVDDIEVIDGINGKGYGEH